MYYYGQCDRLDGIRTQLAKKACECNDKFVER